jgi:prepilin-type N-terminal cleavage/methylation domain-containing protein
VSDDASRLSGKYRAGFTLIEVLVSLLLFGVLIVIASGLLLPLNLVKTTSTESKAVSFGRSYIEIVKSRWQIGAAFSNTGQSSAYALPTASDTGSPDIKLPTGWTLETNSATWSTTETTRTLTVTVKPSSTDVKTWISLSVVITKPS